MPLCITLSVKSYNLLTRLFQNLVILLPNGFNLTQFHPLSPITLVPNWSFSAKGSIVVDSVNLRTTDHSFVQRTVARFRNSHKGNYGQMTEMSQLRSKVIEVCIFRNIYQHRIKETTCLDLPWKKWSWNVLSKQFKAAKVQLRNFRFSWWKDFWILWTWGRIKVESPSRPMIWDPCWADESVPFLADGTTVSFRP
jgi:hypothetical protein